MSEQHACPWLYTTIHSPLISAFYWGLVIVLRGALWIFSLVSFLRTFLSQDNEQVKQQQSEGNRMWNSQQQDENSHTHPWPTIMGTVYVTRETTGSAPLVTSDHNRQGPNSGQQLRRGQLGIREELLEKTSSLLRESHLGGSSSGHCCRLDRTPESMVAILPSARGKSQHQVELRGERAQFFDSHDLAQ